LSPSSSFYATRNPALRAPAPTARYAGLTGIAALKYLLSQGPAPLDVEAECDLPQLLCDPEIDNCIELIQFGPLTDMALLTSRKMERPKIINFKAGCGGTPFT